MYSSKTMSKILLICFTLFVSYGEGAKILGVFMYPSISHQLVFQPIWKELSLRGHQVTIITPNPLKDPSLTNLTEIDVSFTYNKPAVKNPMRYVKKEQRSLTKVRAIFDVFMELFEEEMQSAGVQELLNKKDEKFDLFIVQISHYGNVFLPFANKYNTPVVGISSLGAFLHTHDVLGNPTHPVISPDILLGLSENMSFLERLNTFLYNISYRIYYYWVLLPEADKFSRKYFGDDIPYLGELDKNLSLVMLSANPLIHPPRPNVPNIININQLNVKEKKPLPKDIQEFLDSSPEGVIYFSLGSNVRSSSLSQELRKEIIGALAELPYKVIWKWEEDHLPNQPKNVMVRKWLPQQDILGHPNVKVFFMQGGLQSIEETINNEVPLVGMPFFTDQPANLRKIEELGMGLMIDHVSLTKDKLKAALLEVAQNKKYKENVIKGKAIINDQPMKGVEKAVWWIEYVLRHNGAKHLRSAAADMSFYNYFMVDVVLFLLACVILTVYIVMKIAKTFMKKPRKLKKN
ncbi:unnamed protein product [Phyllotreta striolata]|uniref:UDP-glucuronosyltransferase n=1 Tax=Phyllotreta striolata TaxID=444603 RepID=A0A9N9TPL7_PHYSR|nr:unnamed protein product [Phyllotreta striolata]